MTKRITGPVRAGGLGTGTTAAEEHTGLRLLDSVLAQTNQPFLAADFDGRLIRFNRAFERLSGRDAAALREMTVKQLMPGCCDVLDRRRLDHMLESSAPLRTELALLRGDGSTVPISVNCDVYRNDRGEAQYLYSFLTDLSELRLDSNSRARELRFLNDVIAQTAQPFVAVNLSGRLLRFNRAFEALVGFGADELRSMTLRQITPERWHASDDRRMRQLVATGQPVKSEKEYRRKDGAVVPVSFAADAYRNEQGEVEYFYAFVTDLGDQKSETRKMERIQAELRESEERLRTWFESAALGMAIFAPDGTTLKVNPALCRMLGYTETELTAPNRPHTTHPDDVPAEMASRRKLLDGEIPTYQMEARGLRKDGRMIWTRRSVTLVRDGAGQPRHLMYEIEDITEQKEQQDRILRLSRIHAVLSGINSLIVRERDRQELFRAACRILVEQGQFRMAWIGVVAGAEIKPVAVHGDDRGYLEQNVRIRLRETGAWGQGPVADAMRALRPYVCNDIAADPDMADRREAALQRGYRSAAKFPLLVGGQLSGLLGLYDDEVGAFDEEEQKLLADLAADISHAMEFIARDEKIDYLAFYDPLTRLPNRRLFVDRLGEAIRNARHGGEWLAVLVVDLDHFKSVNDTLGMPVGDQLLRAMAARLTRFTGDPHCLARIGGDRFAAIVPKLAGADALLELMQDRLWRRMERPYRLGRHEMHIAAKVGIALFPSDGDDAETLFHNAESALKAAKRSGERYLFYTRKMSMAVVQKLSLESKLRRALERQEFVLDYQPKLDLRSGRICGAEALIRWLSPERGPVLPQQFIGALEESRMILEVGAWALRQAAADLAGWVRQGLPALPVAVNVSAVQLRQSNFLDVVRDAVGTLGGEHGLDLEVTESVLMDGVEQNIQKLRTLRDMGVGIAIDDFGTGYSSLAYLTKLPVTAVKIDRSFVVRMTDSADTMNIVSTIVSLAHSMNLKVIAEGVDSPEQLKFLRLLRCDEMQGFLFSKGVSAQAFATMLRQGRTLAPD